MELGERAGGLIEHEAEGFELVAMYNGVLCYKRPMQAGVAPAAAPSAPMGFPGY